MTSILLLPACFPRLSAEPSRTLPPARHPGAGQSYYFVLTDRFENGDPGNDTGGIFGGPQDHGFDPTRINTFHGGDFRGLVERLDYLSDLGVTEIWITPPVKNKAVQRSSAGYHGYWILDFLGIDPHLGSDANFREFIAQAHARGIRVCMDIVVNHTADVIQYQGGDYTYRTRVEAPYRDADGLTFDDAAVAFNGLNDASAFPQLSISASFPYVPIVPEAEEEAKNPMWLNDPTFYHNRGNSTFVGESSTLGDFSGLDDVFTENPRVVNGMIEIFTHWLEDYDLDGYRIDTVRHVNHEFWQAFCPAIRNAARAKGRPDFLHFGEVANPDPAFLSQWTTNGTLDSILDFAFAYAAREFVSRGGDASELSQFFDKDDLYTDHDSDAHTLVTFLGNHDMGRFAYFLTQDNPGATSDALLALDRLGLGLLYLVRGQPCLYYGDEQGMVGTGGDNEARQDMFATQVPDFADLARIGTTATGAVAKFDEDHPLFETVRSLNSLRKTSPALVSGAMIPRDTTSERVFAFSRIDRVERVEYLVALNNSRTTPASVWIPTAQAANVVFDRVFASRTPSDAGDETTSVAADGRMPVVLEPLQLAVWRARDTLPAPLNQPQVTIVTPESDAQLTFAAETTEGQRFPSRHEVRAEVTGATDYAEVTFALLRSDRPSQSEILGVDDAPPYRIFWRPPADLAPGTEFDIVATVDNLRGGRASARVNHLTTATTGTVVFGIQGSTCPEFMTSPASLSKNAGGTVTFRASATGTPPLTYQWLKNGQPIAGASENALTLTDVTAADSGDYAVLARNLAGTTLSQAATLEVEPTPVATLDEQPESATVAPGGSATFHVGATSELPLTYQWTRDGREIAGAQSNTLRIEELTTEDDGDYAAIITAGGESFTTATAHLLVAHPLPGRLVNLSTRTGVGSGEQTLIAGFALAGTGTKSLLVRGIGPSLTDFGVHGALADPQLDLYPHGGHDSIASNDNWGGASQLSAAFATTGAFALTATSADAALLAELEPGAYTAHVSGSGDATGIALAEVFDNDANADARLVNVSTRSEVGAGDNVLIAGFVLSGNVPGRFLMRGIGPSLAPFGVVGVLPDPELALFKRGESAALAGNDDWGGTANLREAFHQTGAFDLPMDSLDAALLITVVPGAYTAHLSARNGVGGVGLLEIYELPGG